ncbi:MAG: carbamoyltransferase [Candidatus Hinthialibacter antarcticus]|nr:carbamoyltransferase [Candidatus Hinthialibacter antarcticus]
MTAILGISAFYHDSAACLVKDGHIVAAAQEERFSRRKGDARFPEKAIEFCLAEGGVEPDALDAVAYYDKPIQTFSRLLQSYLEYPFQSYASFKASIPVWLKEKLKIPKQIDARLPGYEGPIYFSRHHESHAASAFFCSPFDDAALLVVDAVGEWACTSIGVGEGNQIRLMKEQHFPHSLGLFYSAMTQYLGFAVNFDEYKVMGLAPYGEPKYVEQLRNEVIDLKADGSIALNLKYFRYQFGLTMISPRLGRLLGQPKRHPRDPIEQFHMDVAASVQSVCSEAMVKLARTAKEMTSKSNLCMAGGVALNCVGNGAIYREKIFDNIYIQPAANDPGGAIGAAMQVWHQVLGNPRAQLTDAMNGAYLGPKVEAASAKEYLDGLGREHNQEDAAALPGRIAQWIGAGYIVGLCQGRMEFGPRALGARSILGDPRDPESQSRINRKVKYRESFRPFAPAILEERVKDYFDIDIPSPYMLFVMPINEDKRINQDDAQAGFAKLNTPRSDVPAVTHVDNSVRLQTVNAERNPFFYEIVAEFDKQTGCPMIVNTSFNVRGEPIVCDHVDAYHCFCMTDIDILVIDNIVIAKPGVDLDKPMRDFAATEAAP